IGFDPRNVIAIPLTISRTEYPAATDRADHVARLLSAIRVLPGVEAAATTQTRFVLAESNIAAFDIEGQAVDASKQQIASLRHVTPELFRTLRMRVTKG